MPSSSGKGVVKERDCVRSQNGGRNLKRLGNREKRKPSSVITRAHDTEKKEVPSSIRQ